MINKLLDEPYWDELPHRISEFYKKETHKYIKYNGTFFLTILDFLNGSDYFDPRFPRVGEKSQGLIKNALQKISGSNTNPLVKHLSKKELEDLLMRDLPQIKDNLFDYMRHTSITFDLNFENRLKRNLNMESLFKLYHFRNRVRRHEKVDSILKAISQNATTRLMVKYLDAEREMFKEAYEEFEASRLVSKKEENDLFNSYMKEFNITLEDPS